MPTCARSRCSAIASRFALRAAVRSLEHQRTLARRLALLAGRVAWPFFEGSGLSSPVVSGLSCAPEVVLAIALKITRMAADRSLALTRVTSRGGERPGMPTTIADLGRLVRIPSVSWDGFDPGARRGERRGRSRAAGRRRGVFEYGDRLRGAGPRRRAGSARGARDRVLPATARRRSCSTPITTLQPPGDEELWESAPFEPTVRGDRLYGRGARRRQSGRDGARRGDPRLHRGGGPRLRPRPGRVLRGRGGVRVAVVQELPRAAPLRARRRRDRGRRFRQLGHRAPRR